jgi:hypothetical protein
MSVTRLEDKLVTSLERLRLDLYWAAWWESGSGIEMGSRMCLVPH